MLRALYNLLFPVAFIAMLPGILRRLLRRGNYRRGFGQRFGWYAPEVKRRLAQGPQPPWFQAVSVGEMLVALKLIAAFRERCPGLRMVLSTTTTTGMQLARERAGENVEVIYSPIDSWSAVRRAYTAIRPSQVIIVDGGLWPNLLWEARSRGIPVTLANARLSPRSEGRFRRFGVVARSIFRLLDVVCVSDGREVQRWVSLGVRSERIRCTGNVKFDEDVSRTGTSSPAECLEALGVSSGRPVFLAASTHPGEERLVAEAYLAARKMHPGLFLVVAPRHAERASEVVRELESMSLAVALRSSPQRGEVLLIDTTGELREWPGVATAVFIGKSILAIGGQNPAEAAAAGRPILLGPHMENFEPFASELVSAGAAFRVDGAVQMAAELCRLLENPSAAALAGEAGRGTLAIHQGAAARTVGELIKAGRFSACH